MNPRRPHTVGGGTGDPDVRRSRLAAACIAIAALTLVLRLPGLLEPHHYSDEGIFAAVAQRLLQGHTLYREAWDDKPPLIFCLYAVVLAAFGPSMVALRAVAGVWAAATAVAVTAFGYRLASPRAGMAAGIVYALLTSTPFIEGNLALTELFGATPAAISMLVLAGGADRPRASLAGVLLGIAFLFKQVYALEAVAAGLYLLLTDRSRAERAFALTAGFALAVLATVAILGATGALREAAHAALGFYGGYLSEGSALPAAFRWLRPAPVAVSIAVVLVRRRRGQSAGLPELLVLWLGFSLTGSLLALRPFGHYLVQPAAPVALMIVWSVTRAARRQPLWPAMPLAAALPLIAVVFAPFWLSFPMVRPGYYRLTLGRLTGHVTPTAADRELDRRVPPQAAIARQIRAGTERSMFIWGELPWLYPLAGARSPVRFVAAYHTAFVAGGKAEVMAALHQSPPRYIVVDQQEWRRLPGLAEFIAARYAWEAGWDEIELYRRRDAD